MKLVSSFEERPKYFLDTFLIPLPKMTRVACLADVWAAAFLKWCNQSSLGWMRNSKILCRRQNDFLFIEVASPIAFSQSHNSLLNSLLDGFGEEQKWSPHLVAHLIADTPELSSVNAWLWRCVDGIDGSRFAWNTGEPIEQDDSLVDDIVRFHDAISRPPTGSGWCCISNRIPLGSHQSQREISKQTGLDAPSRVARISPTGLTRVAQTKEAGAEYGLIAPWGRAQTMSEIYSRVVVAWALSSSSSNVYLPLPPAGSSVGYSFQAQLLIEKGSALFTLRGTADRNYIALNDSEFTKALDDFECIGLDHRTLRSAKESLGVVFQSAWEEPRGRHGLLASTQMATGTALHIDALQEQIAAVDDESANNSLMSIDFGSSALVLATTGISEEK
ncbi:hypothetical protein [Leucobacter luti]|nr:hypothetical protein [Leucobacter luti]